MKKRKNYNNNQKRGPIQHAMPRVKETLPSAKFVPKGLPTAQSDGLRRGTMEIHVIDNDVIKVPRMEYNRLIGVDYTMDIIRDVLAKRKYADSDMLRAIVGVECMEGQV